MAPASGEVFYRILRGHGIEHFGKQDPNLLGLGKTRNGAVNSMPNNRLWMNVIPTLHILEGLREVVGPIHVNSGYRDIEYNQEVGGSPGSLHTFFCAIDFSPTDRSIQPADVEHQLIVLMGKKVLDTFFGLGIYSNFVHLDCRGLMYGMPGARWTG